jgi:hypothetical protein
MTLAEALEKYQAKQTEQSAVAKAEAEIHDRCVADGKALSVARILPSQITPTIRTSTPSR